MRALAVCALLSWHRTTQFLGLLGLRHLIVEVQKSLGCGIGISSGLDTPHDLRQPLVEFGGRFGERQGLQLATPQRGDPNAKTCP